MCSFLILSDYTDRAKQTSYSVIKSDGDKSSIDSWTKQINKTFLSDSDL